MLYYQLRSHVFRFDIAEFHISLEGLERQNTKDDRHQTDYNNNYESNLIDVEFLITFTTMGMK